MPSSKKLAKKFTPQKFNENSVIVKYYEIYIEIKGTN